MGIEMGVVTCLDLLACTGISGSVPIGEVGSWICCGEPISRMRLSLVGSSKCVGVKSAAKPSCLEIGPQDLESGVALIAKCLCPTNTVMPAVELN